MATKKKHPPTANPVPELVELARTVASPLNPRSEMNDEALLGLSESIKEKGVRIPIKVRPVDGPHGQTLYEVVYGHRRRAAAINAGLERIPAYVVDLSSEEAELERDLENLHREDLHPLDQAAHLERLRRAAALSVEQLATRVNLPRRQVVRTLGLLRLSERAAKAFREGKIELGHALVLAPLAPGDQDAALKKLVYQFNITFNDPVEGRAFADFKARMSPDALRTLVKTTITLDLSRAPFSLKDPALVPEAGSCDDCPFRAGGKSSELFDDLTAESRCTRPVCYETKADAHFQRQMEKAAGEGGTKPLLITDDYYAASKDVLGSSSYRTGKCDRQVPAVYVDRKNYGQIARVCVDEACPVHRPNPRAGTPADREAVRKANLAKRVDREFSGRTFLRVAERIAEGKGEPDLLLARVIAPALAERFYYSDTARRTCQVLGLEPAKASYGGKDWRRPLEAYARKAGPVTLAVMASVAGGLEDRDVEGRRRLLVAAKAVGVNLERIHREVTKELAPKGRKPARGAKRRKAGTAPKK